MNPYTRLQGEAREWAVSVVHPERRVMWRYPKDKLALSWPLDELQQRVVAANQLGWDVVLVADDGGLLVQYRKRHDSPPWEIR